MTSEQIIAIVSAIFVSSGFWNFITKWWETKTTQDVIGAKLCDMAISHGFSKR